jgi:hypothetical protein
MFMKLVEATGVWKSVLNRLVRLSKHRLLTNGCVRNPMYGIQLGAKQALWRTGFVGGSLSRGKGWFVG